MAALTVDLRMASGEREAGAAVVDFNLRAAPPLGRRGIRHQQHRTACHQNPGNNRPGKEPMSWPAGLSSHSCISHGETSLRCATL